MVSLQSAKDTIVVICNCEYVSRSFDINWAVVSFLCIQTDTGRLDPKMTVTSRVCLGDLEF